MNRGRSFRRRAKRRREKQAGCESAIAIGPHDGDSAFAPEGSGGNSIEHAQWLEIKAVRDQYPIPKGMRERIVYETAQIALSPTTRTREKLIAMKLLWTMSEGNRDKGLPAQEPKLNVNISINDVLDAMGGTVDSEDFREFKPRIGGPDDYAD